MYFFLPKIGCDVSIRYSLIVHSTREVIASSDNDYILCNLSHDPSFTAFKCPSKQHRRS